MQQMQSSGSMGPAGEVVARLIRPLDLNRPAAPSSVFSRLKCRARVLWHDNRVRHAGTVLFTGRLHGVLSGRSALHGVLYRPKPGLTVDQLEKLNRLRARPGVDLGEMFREFGGDIWDLGLLGTRVVTTAGVNYLVDALQNLTEPENFKYHGIGTGTGAEASGDTALGTELTTEYNPDNTRATGTLTEGASANIFRTVGTNTIDSGTPAVIEHGIFTQAATGGGTLLDRTKFGASVGMVANDSLQTTYELTLTAGS